MSQICMPEPLKVYGSNQNQCDNNRHLQRPMEQWAAHGALMGSLWCTDGQLITHRSLGPQLQQGTG